MCNWTDTHAARETVIFQDTRPSLPLSLILSLLIYLCTDAGPLCKRRQRGKKKSVEVPISINNNNNILRPCATGGVRTLFDVYFTCVVSMTNAMKAIKMDEY